MKSCANETFPGLRLFISALLMLLAGCNAGTMTVGHYDGTTGEASKTTYSKYYDNGDWLLKDKLGLVILVDHEKKVIPVAHGTAQALGALGPRDSLASGKLSIVLWNFDSVPHQVKFKRMTVPSGALDFQNEVLTAAPHKETETEAGSFPIFNYGTSIHVTLEVEVAGKPRRIELDLLRRTKAQLNQYFSDGAVRPYPWGARSVNQ
ncbi:hypothetical protein [Prosthecobacter sp.]|jgi:hypothetical protein|uniref:hypothetical protein n=1 Tax=Prosthecobacter sp. TaxID=1965333 RepID=UPI0037C8BD1D